MRKEKYSKEFEIFDNILGTMMYHHIIERLNSFIEAENEEEIKRHEKLRNRFINTFADIVNSPEA